MDTLFDKKRVLTTDDDEGMIELGIPCVNLSNLSANGFFRVKSDQKGRIDLFARANCDTDENSIDEVMYFNHIFNPFAIDEGDMLYSTTYNSGHFSSVGEPTLPDGSKHSSNVSGKKELTYAEKVEKAAKLGLGVK